MTGGAGSSGGGEVWQDRSVRVRNLEIGYHTAGSGPPLIFVHGGLEDGRSWTPQAQALGDDFTVIAWDEPGAGDSDDVPDDFRLADYADCLAGVIRAAVGAPAPVIGLSWDPRSPWSTTAGIQSGSPRWSWSAPTQDGRVRCPPTR